MKKLIALLAAATLLPLVSLADMNEVEYNVTVIGTATNSATYVLRGELKAVHVDVPANATGTVAVASAEDTLLSKAGIAADVVYYPLLTAHTDAGAAATFVGGGATNVVNSWYVSPVMAGSITVTVTGQSAGTNAYAVTLIYVR